MQCPRCQHDNPAAGQKFCGECGVPLRRSISPGVVETDVEVMMTRRRLAVLTVLVGIFWSVAPGTAWAGCLEILGFLSGKAVDVVCFESPDLTTTNVLAAPLGPTTPPDNSLPGLPLFAFTPRTDRGVISPNPPDRTPITKSVPGLQVQGRFADDPTGEARDGLRDWGPIRRVG